MPFLPTNQQRQSTEGINNITSHIRLKDDKPQHHIGKEIKIQQSKLNNSNTYYYYHNRFTAL